MRVTKDTKILEAATHMEIDPGEMHNFASHSNKYIYSVSYAKNTNYKYNQIQSFKFPLNHFANNLSKERIKLHTL